MQILYTTYDQYQYLQVEKKFQKYQLQLINPEEFGIKLNVAETGKTPEANAALQARLFATRIKIINQTQTPIKSEQPLLSADQFIIISESSSLEISSLGGEPGSHLHNWPEGRSNMTDEQLIEYCLNRLESIPPEARSAQFRSVFAVLFPKSEEVEYFSGALRGIILKQKPEKIWPNHPFESLFYLPEWEMTLAQHHFMSDDQKQPYQTHHDIAIDQVLEHILYMLAAQTSNPSS